MTIEPIEEVKRRRQETYAEFLRQGYEFWENCPRNKQAVRAACETLNEKGYYVGIHQTAFWQLYDAINPERVAILRKKKD
ncbi:MAG: hypothetical protein AABX11_01030 [Nanoarchaeota archaeon]